jgi:hypothetical protein
LHAPVESLLYADGAALRRCARSIDSAGFWFAGHRQAFDRADAVFPRRRFKTLNRGNTELLVQLQNLIGPKAGNGEQLKHALGHFLAQLLKARVRARLMQLRDDEGDGIADAGQFGECVGGDKFLQRLDRAPRPSTALRCLAR